jgi:hypothetical protein
MFTSTYAEPLANSLLAAASARATYFFVWLTNLMKP